MLDAKIELQKTSKSVGNAVEIRGKEKDAQQHRRRRFSRYISLAAMGIYISDL